MASRSGLQSNGPRLETFSDYRVDLFLGNPKSKSFNIFVINRVREKFSYPLVPWLSKTQEFLSKMFCQVPKPNGDH